MKSFSTFKCVLVSLIISLLFHGLAGAVDAKERFKEGELLVKFKSGVSKEKKEKAYKAVGAKKIKEFKSVGLQQLKLEGGMTVEEALLSFKVKQEIEYAEPNFLLSFEMTPDDTFYNLMWGLNNTGQRSATSVGNDIAAQDAWEYSTGSERMVVAVIDTGIDYGHEDLRENMWVNLQEQYGEAGVDDDGNGYIDDIYGIDAYNNDSDPFDDQSHGTHVAGTIGAVGNNKVGVVGVNWNIQLMACKFLSSEGQGWTSDAIECLEYVRMMKNRGVSIIATNNSWGGGNYSQALSDTINNQSDILFVAAAGNSALNNDINPHYPSSYDIPSILAVAATDYNDNLASFSNYGQYSVDIAAPGYYIASTVPGGYAYKSGTSMAAPHVTGLAALIKSLDESMTASEVKNLILESGDLMPAANHGLSRTDARINAASALSSLITDPGNLPPIADAGDDQTVNEGLLVSLDAANSIDPDDGIESYLWEQIEGVAVDIIDASAEYATFYAPEVDQNETLMFKLTIRDFGGMEASDTVTVNVLDTFVPNMPPVAEAGDDQNLTDNDGSGSETVVLNGLSSYDQDGIIVSYLWKKGALILGEGEFLETELTVGTHLISLIVTDDLGETDTDTVTIIIDEMPLVDKMAIFVNDIDLSAKSKKGGRIWVAKAIVEVLDTNGAPVGGATVYGQWTDKFTKEVAGITLSKGRRDGKVVFTTPEQVSGGTFTFTVIDIITDAEQYDPSLNNETTDSITVQ